MTAAKEVVQGLDQVSLIARAGYRAQEHFVVTEDGYVLSLFHLEAASPHRMAPCAASPGNTNDKGVVLLQSGLLDSSKSLLNLERDSLALKLVDAGWNVWLGNNRGNAWSKRHLRLDPLHTQFWNFTWDEMAAFDLPAQVDYVCNATGADKLAYVGHSQGTMQLFAALSNHANQRLASKLAIHVALAPVAFLRHITSPLLGFLAETPVPEIVQHLGVHDFAPTPDEVRDLFPQVCELLPTGCADLLALGFGRTRHVLPKDYDTFVSGWPSGTSTKNMAHFVQMIRHGRFAKFDYGWHGNLHHYGSIHAPSYNLTHYTTAGVPTVLISGTHDALADPRDVAQLHKSINSSVMEHVVLDGYAHMDFLWARDAAELLYPHVLRVLEAHSTIRPHRAAAGPMPQPTSEM